MTVKKRITVSNIMMLTVPVATVLLVGLLCVGIIWLVLSRSNGLGFESSEEFYRVSSITSSKMYEIFEHSPTDARTKLRAVGETIDKETMFVRVCENGVDFYHSGNADMEDTSLLESAKLIGNNAFVSNENRQLYYYTDTLDGKQYDLYLFSNSAHTDNRMLKIAIIGTVIILLTVTQLSIILTGRFTTRFVFRRIEPPLKLLTAGVEQISRGNLDYRLDYTEDDEFKPVCTAFNDMAARLKASVELARRNEENRKELLLDISHDLRSPLTSIRAYVEGLSDGVASTPEMQKRYLDTIKRKTEDIEKMVSALFAYSKLDMDELEINMESMDVSAFLSSTVGQLYDEYAENGLEVTFEPSPSVRIGADEELLLRIMMNLLDNSRKYRTRETGRCVISVSREGDRAQIEFADDGPGVEDSCLDKLFDIFYRTDKARSNTGSGSGIGLAFVKKAVSAMGGEVYAQKSRFGGLSVIIIFDTED